METSEYQQWLMDNRIACPEVGYPVAEALYRSLEEWLVHNDGMSVFDEEENS